MRTKLLLLPLLAGCATEHEQLLASWTGVYKVERVLENPTSCDDPGLEASSDYRWMELDALAGPESDLVEFRACQSVDDCESVGFLSFLVPKLAKNRMEGANDQVFYSVFGQEGGLCQALHEEVLLTRSGRELTVEVRSAVATDVVAESQEVCIELLGLMAEDPNGCDAMRVIEGRRAD